MKLRTILDCVGLFVVITLLPFVMTLLIERMG